MKRRLIRDIDPKIEGPGIGMLVEIDDEGTLTSSKDLTEAELLAELESDTWDNPYQSWVSGGIQRLTHEEKTK